MKETKLTDICSIQYGYPFDASLFSSVPEDGMPLIRIRDVKSGSTSTYYKGTVINEYIIRKGDFLIGMDGEFNIEPWKSEDALLNQRVCKIDSKSSDVSIRYIYRFLKKELKRIEDDTPFATVKHLSAKRLNQIQLPLPPLSEQEQIVSELDLISGVIEKKKQQLKELDSLAQSVFYEMFGNPVENDKGWEVKKFNECYKLTSGRSLTAKNIINGDYPVYGGNGIVGYHRDYNLDGDNIIIGRVGALCGNVRNVLGKSFITDNAFILTKNIDENNVFILYLLTIHDLRQYARDALQPVVSNSGFKNIDIIIPPLSLQQEFASKIKSIEKQKELIKQSLKETETLFNSRMDFYFN